MIDRYKFLEARYASVHQHLELVAIENIAIPVTKLDIDVLGQQIDNILPTTEYLLRFIDLGINTIEGLSEALGFSESLIMDLLALEETAGNIRFSGTPIEISIRPQGRETLLTRLAETPKSTTKQVIFDNSKWQISSWPLNNFETKSSLDKLKISYYELDKTRKHTIGQADLDILQINRVLEKQNRRAKFEVHHIHRVLKRRYGFKLAKIMIFYHENGESDFIIVIDDERSMEHESILRSVGGLESLGIDFEKVGKSETQATLMALSSPLEPSAAIEDGGPIGPYEHAPLLEEALETTSKRLLIMSPWVNERVVNAIFLGKIESLLMRNIKVVIAWGFGTDRQSEAVKSSKRPLEALFRLAEKYPKNFQFIKLNESHAKVLIYDDVYIATSFNWLSFMGDKRRKYRTEIGEMRTNPSVVQKRFDLMMDECTKQGRPMTFDLIPRE